jgi:hypothetical protein
MILKTHTSNPTPLIEQTLNTLIYLHRVSLMTEDEIQTILHKVYDAKIIVLDDIKVVIEHGNAIITINK